MTYLRRLLMLCLALMLAGICPALAEEAGDNLLYNGSFEYLDEDGLPDGWYTDAYVRQEGFMLYAMDEDARTG